MSYNLILTAKAIGKLKGLSREERGRVLHKLIWLADKAQQVSHVRLQNPPPGLEGTCRYRIGPHRAIYQVNYKEQTLIVIDVIWRRGEYKELYR